MSSLHQYLRILTVKPSLRFAVRPMLTSYPCWAKQKPAGEGGPIPFSSSKAASWSMADTVIAPKRDVPWYQPFSVSFSVAVFMLYFLFLREENDLDVELNYSLFERVPGLEKHQLKVAMEYERNQGRDTKELEERLSQLEQDVHTQKNVS